MSDAHVLEQQIDVGQPELLAVWERGRPLAPPQRALLLLQVAAPELAAAPERCSVGQRDAALMALRGRLFGQRVTSVADCPSCAARVELGFELDDLRAEPPGDPAAPFELAHAGYRVVARAPCAADLIGLAPHGPPAARRQALLRQCVLQAHRGRARVDPAELPEPLVARIAARMAEADPQADLRLALRCAACGHTWEALFDIVAFLWRELDAWARRTLFDIHTLARAYGWGEAEILALSPARRALYLELVQR